MLKSKLLLTVVAAGLATAAFAQPYVQVQAGYAFPTSESVYSYVAPGPPSAPPSAPQSASATSTQSENITGTGGSGLGFGAAFGYGISEHISAQLGVGYGINSQVIVDRKKDNGDFVKTTASGTTLRLIPALVLSTGKEGLAAYARFGLILPVAGSSMQETEAKTGTTTTKSAGTGAGQFSVGFNSALGVAFNVNEKIAIFGEAELSSLSIKGKSKTVTKYEVTSAAGTTNVLETFKTYSKQTNYVDKLDSSSNNSEFKTGTATVDLDKAKDELAPMSNNNSIGINVGVKIKF